MDKHKLGVIIPYRNRYEHLKIFKKEMCEYLDKNGYDYELIIIEQDDAKLFNRGMLLNIGYKYAKKLKCDYIAFHDVDMIPVDVDYSYSNKPIHLATDFILENEEKRREVFEEYFGGVTLFPSEDFEKINGYSNKYWGWGYEDTDLLLRCYLNELKLDKIKLNNVGENGKVLKFNGIDSYVKIKNIIDFNSNATFSITFHPDKLILDHTKENDEFKIFSIPGWDFSISYNSFSRYNFCTFDNEKIPFYINTPIKKNYKTNITVVMNAAEKYFSLYQDGEYKGATHKFKKLYPYRKSSDFYIGVGDPQRKDNPNFFRGTMSSFMYFDEILTDNQIKKIFNYGGKDLDKSIPTQFLKIQYNTNHITNYMLKDLSGNNNDGKIIKCEIIKENIDNHLYVYIPYRRVSKFRSLKHEENGFMGYKWKDQTTRWNQLRFHNEVSLNHDLIKNDGLSDLEFIEYGKINEKNILHVNVGIWHIN